MTVSPDTPLAEAAGPRALSPALPRSPRTRYAALLPICLVAGALLALASCAAGPGLTAAAGPTSAGFWLGLWHGLIAPISFLVSLFTDDVSIYEVHNDGNWYDAGFMLGISTIFSSSARSGALAQRRRTERRRPTGASV